MLPQALKPLADQPQWVTWRMENGTKVPVSPRTGRKCDPHDPIEWVTIEEAARAVVRNSCSGLAFVITEAAGFWCLDIDKALQPDGSWSQLAQDLCQRLQGCAVEVSQSGRGLHIFGRGTVPAHRCKSAVAPGIELYTDKRFIAVTGTSAIGDAAYDATVAIDHIVAQLFAPDGDTAGPGDEDWRDEAAPEWVGPADDEVLIQRALAARPSIGQALLGKATLAQLMAGDVAALSQAFPAIGEGKPYDASSADAALAQHLAFWTGRNTERMRRIMRTTALVREKWDTHRSYLWRTVSQACGRQGAVYVERKPAPPAAPSAPLVVMEQLPGPAADPLKPEMKVGSQIMASQRQIEYFDGCVYVADQHRVSTHFGMLKPDQFKVMFGGFDFTIDTEGSKLSRDAWEVFTQSRAVRFPKVDGACFRPEAGAHNLVMQEGRRLINTYRPIVTAASDEDPSPFLNHVAKLLPDERDREILLGYMASVVQNPGKKYQWWPVIQGAEGNGKSILARVMEHCVGQLYTHIPKASELAESGGKFNGWLNEKLLLIVEEICTHDRAEMLESLKELVTNDRLEVQGKGKDQVTGDNRANGLCFTNHRNGITGASVDKRRWCVMYTAQQNAEDIIRDGMGSDYFPRLYDWLRAGGFAAVNGWLRRHQVAPWLQTTLMTRAPATSSTPQVVIESRGTIEQEVQEAIDSERQGFRAGWVSATAMERLLREMGRARSLSHNRRTEMLRSMGYIPHPGLLDGRTPNPLIYEEGTRPRLFLRRDHLALHLAGSGEIVKRYIKDQGYIDIQVPSGMQRSG